MENFCAYFSFDLYGFLPLRIFNVLSNTSIILCFGESKNYSIGWLQAVASRLQLTVVSHLRLTGQAPASDLSRPYTT